MDKKQSNRRNTIIALEEDVDDHHHDHNINDDLRSNLLRAIIFNLPEKSRSRIKCARRPRKMLASDSVSLRAALASTTGFFYKVSETKCVYCDKRKNTATYTTLDQPTYNFMTSSSNSLHNHAWTPKLSLEFLPFYPSFSIRDSCNGLLLCSSYHDSKIYVCNPWMRKWVSFPSPEGHNNGELLAYDRKRSPHHFKVFGQLRLPHSSSKPVEVKVFSSSTRSWDKFELTMKGPTLPSWNTKHWASYDFYHNGTVYARVYPEHLIAVPVKEGEDPKHYQLIKLPECYGESYCRSPTLVGVCTGRVCYIANDGSVIRVWMMTDRDRHKWVLKKSVSVASLEERVSLPNCYRHFGDSNGCDFHPLVFDPCLSVVYLRTHCLVFKYDWESDKVEDVSELSRPGHHDSELVAVSCCFSIISYNPSGNLLKFGHKW